MPRISLVVLAWNNLEFTQKCVASLRDHTDLDHELVLVDNGSEEGAASWARDNADVPVLNDSNLGFAAGMNAGLATASGDYIAFINNDTVFPPGWASSIVGTFDDYPSAGIVTPAVTAAGNPVTVRDEPGAERIVFNPFGELPSGVVYAMRTDVIRSLGGWNESYPVATAEDLDLLFTVWVNGLDVILDTRVLVEHESRASFENLPKFWEIQEDNLRMFLDRWQDPGTEIAILSSVNPDVVSRNQRHAAAAAAWLDRLVWERRRTRATQKRLDAALEVPAEESHYRGRWWWRRRT
ncbi:MAG: glycosyltransferase [Acidimicrobiia bacterium]|nr:glycosyltransferase [Acidimicrobiia bacterium]